MRSLIVFIFFAFNAGFLSAQPEQSALNDLHELKINDPVPDISLGKMIHYYGIAKKLSDFKGKLLIIDFWASWCSPCVKSLASMDSLQNKYGDSVFILPVDELRNEKGDIVGLFMDRMGLHMPSIIEDTTIGKLFPHEMIPHDVWIDKNGIVIAITSSNEITENNIERVLRGSPLVAKQKTDILMNMFVPLFWHGNGGTPESPMYRSILTDSADGLPGYVSPFRDSTGKMVGFSAHDLDIPLFYATLTLNNGLPYGKRIFFQTDKGLIRAPDTIAYHPMRTPWPGITLMKDYAYSMLLPKNMGVTDSLFFRKYMLDDLNRCLPVNGKIEKMLMPCLVIVKKNKEAENLLRSKHSHIHSFYTAGPVASGTGGSHDIWDRIQRIPFSYILRMFSRYPYTKPIINESGIDTELVDMEIHLKLELDDAQNKALDISVVKKALNKYGLDIIDADRFADVLVLYKKE